MNAFSCASGQCIPQQKMCDGKIDCVDNSDETLVCQGICEVSSVLSHIEV